MTGAGKMVDEGGEGMRGEGSFLRERSPRGWRLAVLEDSIEDFFW